jgi:hypothetical protein
MFEQPLAVLMMRRHEKDFMLRHDRKYGDDLKERASGFATGSKIRIFPRRQRSSSSKSLLIISAIFGLDGDCSNARRRPESDTDFVFGNRAGIAVVVS